MEENKDELKAHIEDLKQKLALEHGMQSYQCDGLSPELESQWLNYIYRHEQLHRTCGQVTVYEYVGRPSFTAIENLERENITAELERLLAVMRSYGVQLDCICEYDDAVIYRFITTELFAEEMDNIHMPGLINHFTYEDFHMNNQYELERIGVDLIKSIYNHEWRAEYDSIWVGAAVKCNGIDHDFHGFSSVITTFQQRHAWIEIRDLVINEISVDEVNARGQLTASLTYRCDEQVIKGDCSIFYRKDPESGYWSVTDINMPGVGQL